MKNHLKKVVVIGPESTGKSTLCQQLAEHYDTVWVPEYARTFLEANDRNYSYEDLLDIAKGQIELENKMGAMARNNLLFIDTDMHVMKVWCDFVFGKCHDWILENLSREYDFYLLCKPDQPWVKDNLREYPDLETREKLFDIYKEIMQNQNVPWVEIYGNYEERFKKAVEAIGGIRS